MYAKRGSKQSRVCYLNWYVPAAGCCRFDMNYTYMHAHIAASWSALSPLASPFASTGRIFQHACRHVRSRRAATSRCSHTYGIKSSQLLLLPSNLSKTYAISDASTLRVQPIRPSGEKRGNEVTMGDFVRDLLLCQHYFETIFTRIPKKILDSIVEELQSAGLPHTAKTNAGQGGGDRRGAGDGRGRPASVKVPFFSLFRSLFLSLFMIVCATMSHSPLPCYLECYCLTAA